MAIVVQHGNVAALGQAAASAGQAQDFWRRFDAEQQLVAQARQRQDRQRAMQMQQQERTLQQQMRSRQAAGTPTAAQPAHVRGPLAADVDRRVERQPADPQAGMVPLHRQQGPPPQAEMTARRAGQAPAEIPPGGIELMDEQGRLRTDRLPAQFRGDESGATSPDRFAIDPTTGQMTATVGGVELTDEEIAQRGGFVTSEQPAMGTPLQASKMAYAQARLAESPLPEHMQAALTELAMSEDVTYAQFIQQVEAASERATTGPGQQYTPAQQLSAQRWVGRDEIARAEEELEQFRTQHATSLAMRDHVPDEQLTREERDQRATLKRLEHEVEQARQQKRHLMETVAGRTTSSQEGQTATHPQTGERIVFQGGRWQPLSGRPEPPDGRQAPAAAGPGPMAVPPPRTRNRPASRGGVPVERGGIGR